MPVSRLHSDADETQLAACAKKRLSVDRTLQDVKQAAHAKRRRFAAMMDAVQQYLIRMNVVKLGIVQGVVKLLACIVRLVAIQNRYKSGPNYLSVRRVVATEFIV
jgi:hypothetical protein